MVLALYPHHLVCPFTYYGVPLELGIMTETYSILIEALGLAVVGLTSTPSFVSLYESIRAQKQAGYQCIDVLYEDGDGAATIESQKEFSTAVPTTLGLIGSIFGFTLSIATAVYGATRSERTISAEHWLVLASWVGNIESYSKTSINSAHRLSSLFRR